MARRKAAAQPPEGFTADPLEAHFLTLTGPFFISRDGDIFRKGFWVEERHCNMRGILHGGMFAAFADTVLGHGAGLLTGMMPTTVRLSVDFVAPARPGDWLEGAARLMHRTASIAFMEAEMHAGAALVGRAGGVFKLTPR